MLFRQMLTALLCLMPLGHVSAAMESTAPKFGIIDWFPFGWIEDGQNKGMMVDLAGAMDAALQANSEIIVAPVPRVLRGMEEGEFDFTLTYRDPEMMGAVNYLADVGCLRAAIVSFKEKPVRKLADLNGLRVAYPGGGYFVKRFLPDLDLDGHEVALNYIMFRMALRGRLDAFVINDAVWQGYRNNLYPGFRVPENRWQDFAEPYYHETLPMAVSVSLTSGHQALAERMRKIMSNPAFVKALQAIYDKYELPGALKCLTDGSIENPLR